MKKKIKRIAPIQLGKVLGVLYGLGSLVVVPFFLLFGAIASLAPESQNMPQGGGFLFLGMGLGAAIVMPLFYALMGFLFGSIGAAIYNLVAGWIGGIEVELDD